MENLKQYIKEIIRQEIKIVPNEFNFNIGDKFSNTKDGNITYTIIAKREPTGAQEDYFELEDQNGSTYTEPISRLRLYLKKGQLKKELDEESMSGDAGAYSTPYAFKKVDEVANIPHGVSIGGQIGQNDTINKPYQDKTSILPQRNDIIFIKDIPENEVLSIPLGEEYKYGGSSPEHKDGKTIYWVTLDLQNEKYHFKTPDQRYYWVDSKLVNKLATKGTIQIIKRNNKEFIPPHLKLTSYENGKRKDEILPLQQNKIQEQLDKQIKKALINEITYGKFKNTVSQRSKAETLNKAVREVKRKINEIDRIVEYTSRMKQELSESEGGVAYWARTSESIKQIEEMLSQVTQKCSNLNK